MAKPKSNFNKRKKQIKTNKIKKQKNENKVLVIKSKPEKLAAGLMTAAEVNEKYPILKDSELIKKIHGVSMTNNQKGRLRQLLRDNLIGTSDKLLPDVINCKIQGILRNTKELTEAELRKVRILFNMLKNTTDSCIKKETTEDKPDKSKMETDDIIEDSTNENNLVKDNIIENNENKKDKKIKKSTEEDESKDKSGKEEEKDVKKKGPKRYVVFIGNLAVDIDKEKLIKHFDDVSTKIKDVRLPPRGDDKKSCIAYLELEDEPAYEMALSKHHSMLQNRRIKVLYSTQKNSKVSKEEAKSKSAKLVALQKTGKLIGSVPINRKRSFRRKKQKLYEAKATD